jgi:hypothetical protein
MPRKPTPKKRFEEKFEEKNGKWVPRKGGDWQTKGDVDPPTNLKGEIEPWADSLRIWMCEMNQWAETVTEKLNELESRLPAEAPLSGGPTQQGGFQ